MLTFTDSQINVFLKPLGEKLTFTSGSTTTVIFNSETYAIDTEAGVVETQQYSFTAKSGSASYSDTFYYKEELQEIYNITDDLSGLSEFHFRKRN